MFETLETIRQWMDAHKFLTETVQGVMIFVSAAGAVFAGARSWLNYLELMRQRNEGEAFGVLKIQNHAYNRKRPGVAVLRINNLGTFGLSDVLVEKGLAERAAEAARNSDASDFLGVMLDVGDQNALMRDLVGKAGELLPADADDHIGVLLWETASSVERKLHRFCLYTIGELRAIYLADIDVQTEKGKEHQDVRIDANRTVARLLRNFDPSQDGPEFRDVRGRIVAHAVKPSLRDVARVHEDATPRVTRLHGGH